MIEQIIDRTVPCRHLRSLGTAFSSLDDHEKLLFLYYHVENLKLVRSPGWLKTPIRPCVDGSSAGRRTARRTRHAHSRIDHNALAGKELRGCVEAFP